MFTVMDPTCDSKCSGQSCTLLVPYIEMLEAEVITIFVWPKAELVIKVAISIVLIAFICFCLIVQMWRRLYSHFMLGITAKCDSCHLDILITVPI